MHKNELYVEVHLTDEKFEDVKINTVLDIDSLNTKGKKLLFDGDLFLTKLNLAEITDQENEKVLELFENEFFKTLAKDEILGLSCNIGQLAFAMDVQGSSNIFSEIFVPIDSPSKIFTTDIPPREIYNQIKDLIENHDSIRNLLESNLFSALLKDRKGINRILSSFDNAYRLKKFYEFGKILKKSIDTVDPKYHSLFLWIYDWGCYMKNLNKDASRWARFIILNRRSV